MKLIDCARVLEYQLQLGILPRQNPTKVGTLTPLATFVILILLGAAVAGSHLESNARALQPGPGSSKTIRVMTYNIHVGIGMDKKLDLARVADVINKQRPDLVGLQEVDRGVQRTQRIDEITELAKLTQMDFAFAFNLPYQGGQYGVAILSRFPIKATENRHFKNLREAERRGFIRAEVEVENRRLTFVTTHLDYQDEDGRLYEAQQLLAALKDIGGPLIVVGDFNDIPAGQTYQLMQNGFRDAWQDRPGSDQGFTYPADKPVKRIDYIFVRPSDGFRTKRAWVVNTLASDHIPVLADLELH